MKYWPPLGPNKQKKVKRQPENVKAAYMSNGIRELVLTLMQIMLLCLIVLCPLSFLWFYLFIFREKGREGETSISFLLHTEPTTQTCALTRNRTGDLLFCRTMPNQLSHTSQGKGPYLLEHRWQHKALEPHPALYLVLSCPGTLLLPDDSTELSLNC